MRLLVVPLLCCCSLAFAGTYSDSVDRLDFGLLTATFDEAKVDRLLGGAGASLEAIERQSAAVLVTLGAIDASDLSDEKAAAEKLADYIDVMAANNPALLGRIGDVSLFHHLAQVFEYDALLDDNVFLETLGQALSAGVLTGYDLRQKGIYDDFPAARTFIYSQSSLLHMRQLVSLLRSEDINGWVYVTPKVSAFLYRDDWGPASDAVVTLAGGVRVVQGREFAVLFRFDSPDDRARFHEVVTRYAKKDEKDEPGLIANAWWQPFYYTDEPLPGFEPISLVIISSERHEATLTVLNEKTAGVVEALKDERWDMRVEKVWVNPPFFRFLNGGYK